ncbi:MAG: hypothetical protein NPIRA02_41770 [Nitrospirales bacterium]|nr:MAG: hypothetical protein NPIRA02_41770 [Nitrospirales bacterium]
MAMITGTVDCFRVSEGLGGVTIRDASGMTETLLLWFNPGGGSGIPPQLTAFTRVLHSMWISQLRDAHANGLTVTIIHPEDSAEVTSVQLG